MTEEFYCVKCGQVVNVSENDNIFHTGFVRVDGVDWPMGLCQEHQVSLPNLPPLEIKD